MHLAAGAKFHLPSSVAQIFPLWFVDSARLWTIHGIWPMTNHQIGPLFCNRTDKFDVKKIEGLLPQLRGAPLITVSAKTGRGLDRLHEAIMRAYVTWNRRVPTSALNRWLAGMLEQLRGLERSGAQRSSRIQHRLAHGLILLF